MESVECDVGTCCESLEGKLVAAESSQRSANEFCQSFVMCVVSLIDDAEAGGDDSGKGVGCNKVTGNGVVGKLVVGSGGTGSG